MRPGIVVSIRINPKDCQSVLDLMDLIGINAKNLSFSQLVSLALSSSLETFRKNKQLPEPDPFQYLERMQGYAGTKRNGVKSEAAKVLFQAGDKIQPPPLDAPVGRGAAPPVHEYEPPEPVEEFVTADTMRIRRKFGELNSKKELSEMGEVTWTSADQTEWEQYYRLVYGDT